MNKKRSSKIMNIMTLRVFFVCKDKAILVVNIYMYSENAFNMKNNYIKTKQKMEDNPLLLKRKKR